MESEGSHFQGVRLQQPKTLRTNEEARENFGTASCESFWPSQETICLNAAEQVPPVQPEAGALRLVVGV